VTEERFTVTLDAAELADLRDRLRRTRWPVGLPGAGWDYGIEAEHLKEVCRYWAEEYSVEGFLDRVNAHPQFTREIAGERLHYYHLAAPGSEELPVLVVHGWPGTVSEMLDVLSPLHEDGRRAVVAPSLPGFGWSAPTTTRGVHVGEMGNRLAKLMAELGYSRYVVHGGDWGALVATELAAAAPEAVAGLHLTMAPVDAPPREVRMEGLTDGDRALLGRVGNFVAHESGYERIQATKPQTLAVGLTDSPAGLAAWVLEKFHSWTHVDVPRDRQLDVVMTHWFGRTADSAVRLYYETVGPGRKRPYPAITVPLGYAAFPGEIYPIPRAWIEYAAQLVHFSEQERGGHFPAMEVPAQLTADLATFFAILEAATPLEKVR